MSGFTSFSIGKNDDNIGKRTDRYKGKKDECDRVSFAWLPDSDGTPDTEGPVNFVGCERIYKEGVGYVLNDGPEWVRLLGEQPKQTIATIIVKWPTNSKGQLDKERFSRGEGWSVHPWIFSPTRYRTIVDADEEWPLVGHDLKLRCTDAQYQKMEMTSCKENLLAGLANSDKKSAQAIAANIFAEVNKIASNIRNEMARKMTLEELREKLGKGSASPVGDDTVADVDGVLDNLLDD